MSSSTGLWAELKRRNVFRVAAAYIVVGWLILQVAEIMLGFTGAPEWVGKALIALLLLGLVPALALAWVFEVSPEGMRRDDGSNARDASPQARRLDVITLGAVVLVVVLLAWQHLGPALTGSPAPVEESRDAAPAPVAAPLAARPRLEPPPFEVLPGSIAVLPFTNRSAEPDTAYFVDGVHDDLLTQLARNPELRVISRTSMMEYRDTTKNLRQIGEELSVATILEGAVQRAGRRVRINAQLIDTSNDAHLWADTFDRELTPENVFDIQSEIAAAIAAALGRTLGTDADAAPDAAAPTLDTEAFDLYLRARSFEAVAEDDIRERIGLYRQALARDEKFTLAMAELGREYTNLYWYITRRDADREEGGRWIDRALALEPDNARLRLARAEYLYRAHLDFDAALRELDRAAQGLPGSAEAIALRAYILRRAGKSREAVEATEAAVLLAPRSNEIVRTMVENGWLLGDLDYAQRWYARLVALPEHSAWDEMYYPIARMQVTGEFSSAQARLERAFEDPANALDPYMRSWQFSTNILAGDFNAAEAALDAWPGDWTEESQMALVPASLSRARLASARGDAEAARRFATDALAALDGVLAEHPDDYRALMARALALAIRGDAAEARESARRALATTIPSRDMIVRSEMRLQELLMLATIADTEEVARAMDEYLQLEMKYWHFDGLVLDPVFAAHRDHPAMRALAAKYSRSGSKS
jgi:TolB-like protein/Tfp pilus assembly protein PilF